MKLTIDRDKLYQAIQKIRLVIASNPTKPILGYCLLTASKDGLILSATNLDVWLRIGLNAEVAEQGAVCAPVSTLINAMRHTPSKSNIAISMDNKGILLRYNDTDSRIPTITADEFPAFPPLMAKQRAFNIPVSVLMDAFMKVNISVPSLEQKLYNAPAGALLNIDGGVMELVGTDGHRMSYVRKAVDPAVKVKGVISKLFLTVLPKIMPATKTSPRSKGFGIIAAENMLMESSGDYLFFTWKGMQICAKLQEYGFPDYKQIILVKGTRTATVNRDQFAKMICQVAGVIPKSDWFLLFKFSAGKLGISTDDPEIGNAHSEMPIAYKTIPQPDLQNGELLEIGLNPRYLLDILSAVREPNIVMEMSDSDSLVVIRPERDNDTVFVVMPMRT